MDLLALADEMLVDKIKWICSNYLRRILHTQDLEEMLKLSIDRNIPSLEMFCFTAICRSPDSANLISLFLERFGSSPRVCERLLQFHEHYDLTYRFS